MFSEQQRILGDQQIAGAEIIRVDNAREPQRHLWGHGSKQVAIQLLDIFQVALLNFRDLLLELGHHFPDVQGSRCFETVLGLPFGFEAFGYFSRWKFFGVRGQDGKVRRRGSLSGGKGMAGIGELQEKFHRRDLLLIENAIEAGIRRFRSVNLVHAFPVHAYRPGRSQQ